MFRKWAKIEKNVDARAAGRGRARRRCGRGDLTCLAAGGAHAVGRVTERRNGCARVSSGRSRMANQGDREGHRPPTESSPRAPHAPLTPLLPRTPSRRPAFNPGLLASPFYAGATSYGGAGAVAANSAEKRQSRLSPQHHSVVAVKPSASTNALSRTAKRIWDLLAHYSSPISDAKRAPARIVSASNASTSSASPARPLQPLRAPSMATLVALKRNNRKVDSAQAAIAASLSSSSPLPPTANMNENRPHSNKMRNKLTGRNRERDALAHMDMPSPVDLPQVTLDVSESGLPDFTKSFGTDVQPRVQPKLKRLRSPKTNGPTTFGGAVSPDVDRIPAKRFLFSDPLDGTDPDANPFVAKLPIVCQKPVPSAAFSDKLKRIESKEDPVLNHKAPAHTWNGTGDVETSDKSKKAEKLPGYSPSSGVEKQKPEPTAAPLVATPLPNLDSFIKKQKSQWECDGCLARNDNDKDKCVCCETPKPGGGIKSAASVSPRPPAVQIPKPLEKKPAFTGFASFMQKQQSQWECPCCLTRNDTNRAKCVCCEATKPGAEAETSKSNSFNFGSNQTSSFKFGIDKADQPSTLPIDKLSEDNTLKSKDLSTSSGFTFGIPNPSTKVPSGPTEIPKTGEFKFGIPNGNAQGNLDKDKSGPSPISNMLFGNMKETPVPVAPGFSFGFNNQKSSETPSVEPPKVSKSFDFTPQQKVESTIESNKDKTDAPAKEVDIKESKRDEPVLKSPAPTSIISTIPASNKETNQLFTFGTPSATSSFGAAPPKFNFGSPASITPTTTPSVSESTTPFKSNIFTFGSKTSSPSNSTPDLAKPVTNAIPKPQFSLPVSNNPTLFSTTTTTTSSIQQPPKITEVTSLTDNKKLASSPFSSPISSLADKSKETPAAAPVFNFVGSATSPTPNAVPNIFKPITTSAAPIFSFGATTTKAEQPNVPIFGSLPANTTANLFGSPPVNDIKTTNNNTFKPTSPPTSTFAPIAGSIFGSASSNQTPQNTSTNLFGNSQATENKTANIFGSSLNPNNISQPIQQQPSVFSQSLGTPAFNFGGPAPNNAAAPNFFGAQSNKMPTAPESNVNSFMNKTQSVPPANIFNSPLPSAAPALSSGGNLFGSHPAVLTPVFGASIPFGDASQTQSAQNVSFKFGEINSTQSPIAGFGLPAAGVPAAGSSAPVFSFGSSIAAPPVNSQFNFSMGAPPPAFPNTPGANPNAPQRRYKKAVRRNVPR